MQRHQVIDRLGIEHTFIHTTIDMKDLKSILFLCLCLFLSCEEIDLDQVCDLQDPAAELSWLSEMIEDSDDIFFGEVSYFSFTYSGSFYIRDGYCGNKLLQWRTSFYNCRGKEVSFSSSDLERIWLLDMEEIWRGTDCI